LLIAPLRDQILLRVLNHPPGANDIQLCIFGAGGHASDLLTQLTIDAKPFHVFCLVDDFSPNRELMGIPVLTFDQAISRFPDSSWMIAIGDGAKRKEIFNKILASQKKIISFVSTHAQVVQPADSFLGVQIFSGCFISANVRLGKGVIINVNSSISHDCSVGDFSTFSPACILGGHISVGDGVYLGLGAKVAHRKLGLPLRIGMNAVVGVGAVVIDDIESDETVVGVPASSIR
jgi:sugar O-acyltransferase (sialic acid O-acetyltransferase NeuD family)